MDTSADALTAADVRLALAHLRRVVGAWRGDESRAAATLALGVTTTPFDVRERVLAALLLLAGVSAAEWQRPLIAPGGYLVPAVPLDAFLQLADRERTYLSNVPVHTPVARVCRALIRLGVIDLLDTSKKPWL